MIASIRRATHSHMKISTICFRESYAVWQIHSFDLVNYFFRCCRHAKKFFYLDSAEKGSQNGSKWLQRCKLEYFIMAKMHVQRILFFLVAAAVRWAKHKQPNRWCVSFLLSGQCFCRAHIPWYNIHVLSSKTVIQRISSAHNLQCNK